MNARDAYKRLKAGVNIQYYIGPNLEKIIKDACDDVSGPEVSDQAKTKDIPVEGGDAEPEVISKRKPREKRT